MTKLSFILLFTLAQLPIISWSQVDPWRQYELQTGLMATSSNEVHLYQNGDAAQALQKLIGDSQDFLLINLLSVECDDATEPFIQQIEAKAKSGTSVHLIINRMYSFLSSSCLNRLEQSGVQISKTKTHASYWVNDQNELLIGSQSLARMFLKANGRNHLDRDLMLHAQGPLATQAIEDFLSQSDQNLTEIKKAWLLKKQIESQLGQRNRAHEPGTPVCFFLSENPDLGFQSWSTSLLYWIPKTTSSLFFSGVKLEYGKHPRTIAIRSLIEKASTEGVQVTYLGNGAQGGNGELTMVLNEWIESWKSHFLPISSWLKSLRDWDSEKVWNKHQENYGNWKRSDNLKIHMYDQFVHYKVWAFDDTSLLVGSANLADESMEKFFEAGVLCRDEALVQEWKKAQQEDLSHAEPF